MEFDFFFEVYFNIDMLLLEIQQEQELGTSNLSVFPDDVK